VRLHTADHASPWRISMLPLLVLAVGALALTGCGGSKSTSSSESVPAAPATTAATTQSTAAAPAASGGLSIAADPEGQLKYDKTSLTAKSGSVAIDFTNKAPLPHNVTVESSSGSTVGATPTFQGGSKKLTLNLKPGTYKFYCSVPGHRQAGMEGTLVVK
jgi:plastocyanin